MGGASSSIASSPCTIENQELNDSVYELRKPRGEIGVHVIFFHGLQLGDLKDAHLRTWMSENGSECWPQCWLGEDFPDAHILTVRYDASAHRSSCEGRLDLTSIGECLLEDIVHSAGIGQNAPVLLVGHGLGGIVIKQLLIQAQDSSHEDSNRFLVIERFLRNVKGVFFYSTPHLGSKLPDVVKTVRPGSQPGPVVEYLKVLSSETARLHEKFRKLRQRRGWRTNGVVEASETRMGKFSDVLVTEPSARNDMDVFRVVSNSDHFTVCRPAERTSSTYQGLQQFIDITLEQVQKEEPESLCFSECVVGLAKPAEDVTKMLEDARIVGIVGMSGIGKATLARKLSFDLRSRYQMTCFISDGREVVRDCKDEHGQAQQLLRKIAEATCLSDSVGGLKLKDCPFAVAAMFRRTKSLLVVMNNVDGISQDVMAEVVNSTLVDAGSRMIITSSDESTSGYCDKTFRMPYLSDKDSTELLVYYAFRGQEVPETLTSYVEELVGKSGGLPLTLKVAGATFGKSESQMWRCGRMSLHRSMMHKRLMEKAANCGPF